MRPSSNLPVGLVLGIATASVILALGGCAAGTGGPGTASASPAAPRTAPLEGFSETERERILAVQSIVAAAASEHDVDPDLINAVIWVESRFDTKAKSPAGARGLMQLMPATAAYLAKRMGEHSPRSYDPNFNVRAGALYLAEMIAKFGDETYAVAAYHAGPGNVNKWLTSGEAFPDYSDVYVAKVMDARARFEGLDAEPHGRTSGTRTPAPPAARAAGPKPGFEAETETEAEDDMIVPELDTLPDAAEIHGIERVVRVVPRDPDPEELGPERSQDEVVFEPHPELDANPGAAPSGWDTSTPTKPEESPKEATRRQPVTKPEHEPKPKPEPEPDETGLGVLPDL